MRQRNQQCEAMWSNNCIILTSDFALHRPQESQITVLSPYLGQVRPSRQCIFRRFGNSAVYCLYQSFAEIAVLQWLDTADVAFEPPKGWQKVTDEKNARRHCTLYWISYGLGIMFYEVPCIMGAKFREVQIGMQDCHGLLRNKSLQGQRISPI